MNQLKTCSLILFAFSFFFLSSCTKKSEQPANSETSSSAVSAQQGELLIGEVGSLTGGEATFGVSTHQGIELAIKEINAAGGVNGKPLRVVVLDDQGKPEEAATAVTRLITRDKVVAILGEVASSRSLAMAPIAQRNQIPMISPSSTNPRVTEVGDYIFRVCFIDPFQGELMAKFASHSLKSKRVAILKDVKNDYSMGLAQFFEETFTKLGGKIVSNQSYSAGDVDFSSQLTAIKTHNPEAIFVPGYYTEVGLIARQARERGIKVPLLGGDGWDSSKLLEIGGEALNGSFFSNHYSPDDQSPDVQKFITNYKKEFGEVPDGLAAMGYDAMLILADALKRTKSYAGADIKAAIRATKSFQGATGTITINEKRDAVKAAVVIEIKNSMMTFKEKVNPT